MPLGAERGNAVRARLEPSASVLSEPGKQAVKSALILGPWNPTAKKLEFAPGEPTGVLGRVCDEGRVRAHANGLDEVIRARVPEHVCVCSRGEGSFDVHTVLLARGGTKDDDTRRCIRFNDLPRQLDPVDIRQLRVRNNDIGAKGVKKLAGRPARFRLANHIHPSLPEHDSERLPEELMIVDEDDRRSAAFWIGHWTGSIVVESLRSAGQRRWPSSLCSQWQLVGQPPRTEADSPARW
jgi:hypothetical protein